MKNIKLIFAICFVFLTSSIYSQYDDYVIFSPSNQSVSVNSGEQIEVVVTAYKLGENPQYSENFVIESREIPDDGYIGRSTSSGTVGHNTPKEIKFKFKKAVSNTLVTKYRFWGIFYDRGNPIYNEIDITVTYNSDPLCNESYPNNLSATNITSTSVILSWSNVDGSNGYEYQFKVSPYYDWSSPKNTAHYNPYTDYISPTSFRRNSFTPSTTYSWRMRTICSSGAFSNWSPEIQFTTLPPCQENIQITQNVNSGQTDHQQAKITITATNIINNNATATYDAGTRVSLKPGFTAKGGSTFKTLAQLQYCDELYFFQ